MILYGRNMVIKYLSFFFSSHHLWCETLSALLLAVRDHLSISVGATVTSLSVFFFFHFLCWSWSFSSLQLARLSCYSVCLFWTNGKQKTLHSTYTTELFTDLWDLPDSFLQDGSCLYYTVWFLSVGWIIHFFSEVALHDRMLDLNWNNDSVVSVLI